MKTSLIDEKDLEIKALIKTASTLSNIKKNWDCKSCDLKEALNNNQLLWADISSAMCKEDCPQPQNIRDNITSLALFIFQKTVGLLADPKPEDLDILIDVNINIAQSLKEDVSRRSA